MKVKDLMVGEDYMIHYRHNMQYTMSGTKRVFLENEKFGEGRLLAINNPERGQHLFQLAKTDVKVIATSHGVLSHVDRPVKKTWNINGIVTETDLKVNFLGLTEPEKVEPPKSKELEKLLKLGYDDKTRKTEVTAIQQLLLGLGIDSGPDENFTSLTIPWVGLATFKDLLHTLYRKSVTEGFEDEG